MSEFEAFLIDKPFTGEVLYDCTSRQEDDLGGGEIFIDVNNSSLNYKDAPAIAGAARETLHKSRHSCLAAVGGVKSGHPVTT
ncbi:hypothetical protein KGQ96_04390 [Halomonas coralii]|uniref:hypothetical protein n=1 Tax=Modicisalibacter sp. R2A 31.J TaxID=2831898 RepID=UPI001CD01C3F|nr:hypothetical protein [Modicisalibacter sp. R2A 31.J]MBZ9557301.1 hypothetical protein [Modicisalibacter sp. R2A 31.J]